MVSGECGGECGAGASCLVLGAARAAITTLCLILVYISGSNLRFLLLTNFILKILGTALMKDEEDLSFSLQF